MDQAASAFYATLPSILRKFDRFARKDGFEGNTISEACAWQERARTILEDLLVHRRMESCPLRPRVTSRTRLPGMVREHLLLETEPDVTLSAYLLIPDQADIHTPVFLCAPGHDGYGKESVAGRNDRSAVREKIDRYHCDCGFQLASMGYVAFCPDSRGQGERREESEESTDPLFIQGSDCQRLAHMGFAAGVPVLGMLTWDLMRCVDYLIDRGEWNTDRIAGCGFSGGGMQILYTAAIDERICAALISGYFYGFRDSLVRMNQNCACNYAPGVMDHFDMGDLGALICPRPLVIQSGREDPLSGRRGLDNVREQVTETRKAYDAFSCPDRLRWDIHPGAHCFDRDRLCEQAAFLTK